MVDRSFVKTLLDKEISSLNMAYDLNFDFSKKFYVKTYSKAVYNNSKPVLNAEDLEVLQKLIKHQMDFLSLV
jgi:hypothetical protein